MTGAWLHLHLDILREFYEQALLGRPQQFRYEAAVAAFVEERKARHDRTSAKRGQSAIERAKFRSLVNRRAARYRKLKTERPKCTVCGDELKPNYRGRLRAKYCSTRCNHRAQQEKTNAKRRAEVEAEMATRPCPGCGASLVGRKKSTKACSVECYRRTFGREKQAEYHARYVAKKKASRAA